MTTFFRGLRSVLTPAAYHGKISKPPFFEGWYFKLVTADNRQVYTVIPGIYLARDSRRSHAFIQVMNGRTGQSTYHTFPVEDFWAADSKFDIRIGPNHFSAAGLSLDIHDEFGRVRGAIKNSGVTPWPVTLRSPGIMGPFAWTPMMECYHGVVSLDHLLSGSLELEGNSVDFTRGRGYIEKDWGQSFPKAWVWMQSNNFDLPGTCLTASIAVIPWLRRSFNGFIIGLWYGGKLYTFATYNRARIEHLNVTDDYAAWVVRNDRYRLEMIAHRAEGGVLRAPTRIEMDRRISETLNASIQLRLFLFEGSDLRLIYQDTGQNAGLEVVGDLFRLMDY